MIASALRFLAISDPGQVRFRSAASTTLSVIVALAVLLTCTRVSGQPVTVAMLGTIVAMQSSAAVKDEQQRSRVVTTVLLFFPSFGAVASAAVLTPLGVVADVGFIAVLFAAVWVRRYGPRGNALGMVAFISYFFALFLKATPGQLPVLAVSIAIGLAATLLVRTAILPIRPRVEVRRLVEALRAVSASVVETASNRTERDDDLLRKRLDALGETALMIDDWLDRNDAALLLSITNEDLSYRIFDAQIATEQLVSALWAMDPDRPWPEGLGRAVTALGSCLQNHPSDDQLRAARKLAVAAASKADPFTTAGVATMVARRAVAAHIAIHHVTTEVLRTERTRDTPKREPEAETTTGLDPNTKAAIQVAVATSAATVLGELISPNRWYWAVLTAFLVFTGASTRGEILTRAGHRLVGTICGVVAGVLLAALVGHNPPLQIALLLICVFCAFYLVTVAYAWLTFFVTVLLAMLYGLLGSFSVQVLELRIAETAAGGLVGIASAYFVFSTGTRSTLITKVDDYLDRMRDVVDEGTESVAVPGGSTELVSRTRQLDNALKAVVTAGKPLQLGLTTRSRRGTTRLLRALQMSNRSAHALARAGVVSARTEGNAPEPATAAALRDAAAEVNDAIETVRHAVAGHAPEPQSTIADSMLVDVMQTAENSTGPTRAAVRALSTLNRTLAEAADRA